MGRNPKPVEIFIGYLFLFFVIERCKDFGINSKSNCVHVLVFLMFSVVNKFVIIITIINGQTLLAIDQVVVD